MVFVFALEVLYFCDGTLDELIDKYRFDRQSIMMICDMLQDDLESITFRN